MVVKLEMCWLSWRCGGQFGDVVAMLKMWWLHKLLYSCGREVGVVVAKLKLRWSSWSCGGYVGDVVVMQAGLRCGSDP